MSDKNLDPIEYLASKGYVGKQGSSGEYAFPCFFCGESEDSRKRKLYVNANNGFYHCKVCDEEGGTYLLQKFFGDDPGEGDGPTPVAKRGKVLEAATARGAEMLSNNERLMLYLLNERGLSPDTIIERRLGYVGGNWSLTRDIEDVSRDDLKGSGLVYRDGPREGQDFFWNHLLIPYTSRGKVVQLRGRSEQQGKGGRYMTGPGESVRIFNEDDLECDNVILCEGEFDAMILAQHLQLSPDENVRSYGVVAIPGVGSLPAGFESMFDSCRRVYIALDPDDPGKKAAIKVKELLGPKARIVELPEDTTNEHGDPVKCDWTYFFTGHGGTWRDAISLIGQASGKRLFSMAEAGVSYRNERSTTPGLHTGYAQFDALIDPGLLPGQLLVLLAKTGTGKTIWLCNLAHNMRDVPVLFISLEQTREEVYERMQRIFRFYNQRATDAEVEDAYPKMLISDANRLSEEDLEALVEEFEIEQGAKPQVIIIDYLGYYARGAKGGSPYEKTSNAVMQLKSEAKRHRAVIVAPHQVNRSAKEGQPIDLDDARDSGVIEETADFLLSIWRLDEGRTEVEAGNAQPTFKLRMSVLKSRHGGKGRQFNLQMDPLTLAIVEDDRSTEAKEAAENAYLLWRGVTYDDLRQKQTQPVQQQIKAVG